MDGEVGGIVANDTLRGEFIYDNLVIAANVIHAARVNGAEKLMFLGSSCIYPRLAPQPLREDSILTGPLEPTSEPYAIAKIAGIKMVEAKTYSHPDLVNIGTGEDITIAEFARVAGSASTPRGPTARPANGSTSAVLPNWAGAQAPRSRTESRWRIGRI